MTGVQFSSERRFSAFSHGTDKNKQIPLDLNGSGGILFTMQKNKLLTIIANSGG